MLDQGCGREATTYWGPREILANTSASKLKGSTRAIQNVVYFLNDIYSSAGHKHLIVNNELATIKIAVVINLKWHNLDYPSFHAAGRPHVTFPVTTKRSIP